ncbi:hypothetical protein [Paractinoplanes deccanensis]|uniref:hypothetical protein n=1 Tax=Paractinoplanes deccanensis TaxID=113561 RepID=UPI001940FAFF|nr:hypothetical protein [Actinoplanes deccanensis]
MANTVTTLTLDLPDPVGNVASFETPPKARVGVINLSGAAEVYFTTDGSTPTVGGDGCHVLPAVVSALEVYDGTPGPTSVVKLISAGTPRVSVRAT